MVWCQEEPKNMGAWTFVEPYLEWVLETAGSKVDRPRYVGRPASAATATGLMSKHQASCRPSSTRPSRLMRGMPFHLCRSAPAETTTG